MRNAVITGATGMLGSSLIKLLVRKGIHVFCVVRSDSKKISNIPISSNVKLIKCDLKNLNELPAKVGQNCDAFFHFGWAGTFGDARNNIRLQELNITYTLDAVEAAKHLNCGVFIGSGSQAEYGRVEGVLKPETPAFPENGYGIAKLAAGNLSHILCSQYGIRHIWARILSLYGPGDGANTMIMSCIHSFLNGKESAFTKGEQLWDYLYCDDAADAFYRMAENGRDGSIYPLGSGKAAPLKDYIYAIRDLVNHDLQPGIGKIPYADKQVMHLCADISKLQQDTGFKPNTDFVSGIKQTIAWINENS